MKKGFFVLTALLIMACATATAGEYLGRQSETSYGGFDSVYGKCRVCEIT